MAKEQGVCNYFRDKCCTEIPQFAGEKGNLSILLKQMEAMRDEHVKNSNWNTKPEALDKIWEWLSKLSWPCIFQIIGMILGGLFLTAAVVICFMLPIIK